jgi:hypothetical protein
MNSQKIKLDAFPDSIEIELIELGPPGTPAENDFSVSFAIKVGEYAATENAWILDNDFKDFLTQLSKLEALRQGRAVLKSATPTDLRLEFYSTDHSGHLAVTGQVSGRLSEHHFQQFRFGFNLEPDQLLTIVRDFHRLGYALS